MRELFAFMKQTITVAVASALAIAVLYFAGAFDGNRLTWQLPEKGAMVLCPSVMNATDTASDELVELVVFDPNKPAYSIGEGCD